MPVLRFAVVVLAVTACSTGTSTPEGDDGGFGAAAVEFALQADRALDGSRFEDVPAGDLADAIVALCVSGGSIEAAIAGLPTLPGDPADDLIVREVLLTGLVEVCPTQTEDASVTEAYISSVRTAVQSSGVSVVLDDEPLIAAGTVACASLDAGAGVVGAVLSAAAILFGVERSSMDELDEALDTPQGIAVGATLASAAVYFCPQHQELIDDFVAGA